MSRFLGDFTKAGSINVTTDLTIQSRNVLKELDSVLSVQHCTLNSEQLSVSLMLKQDVLSINNVTTTYTQGALSISGSTLSFLPPLIIDWTQDQGDVNIDSNNIPLLNYAPNSLASNGTAGLTNYNFTEARKNKLASIEVDAQVNIQADWNASTGGALILNKPTWIPQSDPNYLTEVPIDLLNIISVNSLKIGITTQQVNEISVNSLKIGISSVQASEISVNTLKIGITSTQADAIVANSAKTGITSAQADAIVANSAKTGITTQQANEISANTLKTGITMQQANEISVNTLKLAAGQSVGTSDSPTFNQLTLGSAGVNQSIINLQDFTNIGTDSIAQIKGLVNGSNGGELRFLTKDNGGSLVERLSMINGVSVFKGIGINVNTDDNLQQGQIYNSLVGDKDLAIDAYSGVTDKGISFRTSSGTNRMRIKKNGNVGIGTTDPSHLLEVNGDIQGKNLILGKYGETPKLDIVFAQGSTNTNPGYDKRITIGVPNDFPNGTGYPTHPPIKSMGMNIQNASDGFFIGIEEFEEIQHSGLFSYRPLLKWGDDNLDTPFKISSSNTNKTFEFHIDGKLKVPGVIQGIAGTICKIHILPFTDADTATVSSTSFIDVVSKTFTKTHGTNLFAEIKCNCVINGWGNDTFETRLIFYNNPYISGEIYKVEYAGQGGGGHRSSGIDSAAVYTNGTGVQNSGPQGIYLQARRNNADDNIDFKHGFFKVTEIWA